MTVTIVSEKRCPRCLLVKPSADWYGSKGRYDGLSNYRKDCMKARRIVSLSKPGRLEAKREAQRKYDRENIEAKRKRGREYQKTDAGKETARRSYQKHHGDRAEERRRYRQSERGQFMRSHQGKIYRADPAVDRAQRDRRFRKTFGITIEQYEAALKSQKGVCAICGNPPKRIRLHIDHDHQTGAVRGLLCWNCNMILGRWDDSPEIADRAAAYLRRHAQLRLVV